MKTAKGIFKKSVKYYLNAKESMTKRLAKFPKGSVKKLILKGKGYYYLTVREGKNVRKIYIGKERPVKLMKEIQKRRALRAELKKVNRALYALSRLKKK
ncbi:MAG: hypothetical protein A2Z72_06970 [Omnitrophica bacterium RBG_13_46_9]|nr:MAG: hypothetical protein A2Z72_06970 [Omnitrophica bacterium RBG_13_46_9]